MDETGHEVFLIGHEYAAWAILRMSDDLGFALGLSLIDRSMLVTAPQWNVLDMV